MAKNVVAWVLIGTGVIFGDEWRGSEAALAETLAKAKR